MNQIQGNSPLRAFTINEAQYYLMVTACAACGKGPWIIDKNTDPDPASRIAVISAHCKQCSAPREFTFLCQFDIPTGGAETETINPTDQPSGIIDLAQWLSLFYLLVESAAGDSAAMSTRRKGYQAALCLAEALKFYSDDELPPNSAFFAPGTAEVFRDHPEKFARQKLRDVQSRLPALALMARRVSRDEQSPRKNWWQFWRK